MTDTTKATAAKIAETMIDVLMGRDETDAMEQSRAILGAATTVLQDRFGTKAALEALSHFAEAVRIRSETAPAAAPPAAPAAVEPTPAACAFAALNMLRAMPRDEAHERARAVVAGSGAYLHETYGLAYASALLRGTLDAAADHGLLVRGGPGAGVTLH